jgi:hypothetical protein
MLEGKAQQQGTTQTAQGIEENKYKLIYRSIFFTA